MRFIFLALTMVLAAGCKQNPYEGRQAVQPVKPPVAPKPKPLGTYSLDTPELLLISEGAATEFQIRGTVPVPGRPVITFTGLPTGAAYDAASQKFLWTPDFTAADDAKSPEQDMRLYQITVELKSNVDPHVALTRLLTIAVKDTPRPLNVLSSQEANGQTGIEIAQTVQFEDLDFPAGPFYGVLSGFPDGARVEWTDRTKPVAIVKFTPPVAQTIDGILTVINPKGRATEIQLKWVIQ